MKKLLWFSWLFIFTIIVCVSCFVEAAPKKDRLIKAYDRSHNAEQEPYSSDIEADDMFQTSNQLTIWWWNAWFSNSDSVLVRFTRFMMRLALVIAVSMLIYVWIRVALAFGDSGKLQEALQQGWMVLLGAFLVLASVAIVFLISSLTRGSLDYELFNQ